MKFSIRKWLGSRKYGFTIREILIIIVVISVGLLSVVVVLTDGMRYVQRTRQKVIALNLAREWMEAVYQIRDTNRTRRAWVKDFCWLKINPLVDEWAENCKDDVRMSSGSYVLERLTTKWQQYFALTWPFLSWIDLVDGLTGNEYNYSLCQQSGYWDSCMGQLATTSEGKYFREILWYGVYRKDVAVTWWTELVCAWWTSVDCGTSIAKEFRFCSRVVYMGESVGEVKLCGVLTNFKGE
jgi:type II secretory pathway pseudopilin PulG